MACAVFVSLSFTCDRTREHCLLAFFFVSIHKRSSCHCLSNRKDKHIYNAAKRHRFLHRRWTRKHHPCPFVQPYLPLIVAGVDVKYPIIIMKFLCLNPALHCRQTYCRISTSLRSSLLRRTFRTGIHHRCRPRMHLLPHYQDTLSSSLKLEERLIYRLA